MDYSATKLVICFDDDGENPEESRLLLGHLADYQRVIVSAIGPVRSACKFVSIKSNPTETTTLTNSSFHLFKPLYRISSLSNGLTEWRFETIRASVEQAHLTRHFDSGLFLVYLINESIIRNKRDRLDRLVIGSVLNSLVEYLNESQRSIATSLCLVKLNLDSLDFLRALIRTILFSKKLVSMCLFASAEEEKTADQFVNTFLKLNLNSFNQSSIEPDDTFVFSRNVYLFDDESGRSLNDSLVFNGLLVRQPKFYSDQDVLEFVEKKSSKEALKAVLFDTNSLSGDFATLQTESTSARLEIELTHHEEDGFGDLTRQQFLSLASLRKTLDILVDTHKIDLVLSQKVIHPSLKCHLKKKGVLAIDRLSLIHAQPLAELMNCEIYNSTCLDELKPRVHVGRVGKISVKRIFQHVYVHLEAARGESCSIQTMLVCVPNESFTPEIQNLLEVAECSFRRTIMNGSAVCGGPCFYTSMLCQTWHSLSKIMTSDDQNQSTKTTRQLVWHLKQFRAIFANYFHRLLAHDPSEYAIDLDSGHLFHRPQQQQQQQNRFDNDDDCVCGLFSSEMSNFLRLDDDRALDLAAFPSRIFSNPSVLTLKTHKPSHPRLLDCLESKLNALNVARDIITTLLNVGVFIHD